MGATEILQPGHQPLCREGRRHRHRQDAALGRGLDVLQGRHDALERFGQPGQAGLAFVGQRQDAIGAAEELAAQLVLELLDLLADRAWRHMQFGRCLGEAEMPGRYDEGPQGAQRRQAAEGNTHQFSCGIYINNLVDTYLGCSVAKRHPQKNWFVGGQLLQHVLADGLIHRNRICGNLRKQLAPHHQTLKRHDLRRGLPRRTEPDDVFAPRPNFSPPRHAPVPGRPAVLLSRALKSVAVGVSVGPFTEQQDHSAGRR